MHNLTSGWNRCLAGVEVRANGGYIAAPPSLRRSGSRYAWLDPNQEIAPIPEWFKEPPRRFRRVISSAPRFTTGAGTAYGLAMLCSQLDTQRRGDLFQ